MPLNLFAPKFRFELTDKLNIRFTSGYAEIDCKGVRLILRGYYER